MFDAVDRTLESLLRRGLAETLVEPASISFAPPGSDFPPPSVTLPSINLFLYELRENLELFVFCGVEPGSYTVDAAVTGSGRSYSSSAEIKVGCTVNDREPQRCVVDLIRSNTPSARL